MTTTTSAADEAEIARLKAFLFTADAEGHCMYDELHHTMLDFLEENTLDVVNRPERLPEFMAIMKRRGFVVGTAPPPSVERPVHEVPVTRHADAAHALFELPSPQVTTTVEQPTPYTTITTTTVVPKKAPPTPAIQAEAQMWRFGGVGLAPREAFHLDQSIAKLAMKYNLEDVQFLGKIFGIKSNYLIVHSKRHLDEQEVIYDEVNTMPKPPRKKIEVDVQPEPGYKGCNRRTFWVAPDAVSPWIKLPDTTPQHINAARKIKKMFTGDLNHTVVSYPAFDGTERDYLRAQLSRILSATYICPANALEAVQPEDDEEAEEDDEEGAKKKPRLAKYTPLTAVNKEYAPDEEAGVTGLVDLEQWQHAEAYIYETGRQSKVPPKPDAEEEEEEPEGDEEEPQKAEEEEKELFGPIKKDALYAVISVPKEPNPEDDGDGEEEAAADDADAGEDAKDPNDPDAPEGDEDIPDDDPLKRKIYSWKAATVNMLYKKHGVAIVKSLRWPGAVAYAAHQGRKWGVVYFGDGLKKTDHAFTPAPAEPVQKEAPDMVEAPDPTAANEKLVLRGEEPREKDSEEDEKEEEEEEEERAEE